MICGFNFEINNKTSGEVKKVKSQSPDLKNFLINNEIDTEKLQNDIFPVGCADIFISHSHNDEEIALHLKKWIESNLGLSCFLDSQVWKSADATLKAIDREFCPTGDGYYSYSKRNLSTSYIHVMLCNAIMQVMDKCLFTFFLNTPNSISAEKSIKKSETYSPWLFYELEVLKYIRKGNIQELRKSNFSAEHLLESSFAKFTVDISDLPKLACSDLNQMKKKFGANRNSNIDFLLNKNRFI